MRCFALYSSLTGLWALAANAKPPARPDPQPIELVPTVSTPSNTGITLIVTSFIDDDHTRKLTLSKLTNILTPKQTNDTLSTMGDPPVADSIICSSGPRITNDALTLMIKKLRTREGLPALPAGSCAQVECYFKQGIEWCNEVRTKNSSCLTFHGMFFPHNRATCAAPSSAVFSLAPYPNT